MDAVKEGSLNTFPIRPARESDLVVLQSIERSAGLPFADIGMAFIADDEPPSIETLRKFVANEKAWVSTDLDDTPIAYLLVEVVDGNVHLEQVSVHSDYAHTRIGMALLHHMIEWARGHDLPAVTLTTYTDVPWNGPYYERSGFRYLAENEETPGRRRLRNQAVDDSAQDLVLLLE